MTNGLPGRIADRLITRNSRTCPDSVCFLMAKQCSPHIDGISIIHLDCEIVNPKPPFFVGLVFFEPLATLSTQTHFVEVHKEWTFSWTQHRPVYTHRINSFLVGQKWLKPIAICYHLLIRFKIRAGVPIADWAIWVWLEVWKRLSSHKSWYEPMARQFKKLEPCFWQQRCDCKIFDMVFSHRSSEHQPHARSKCGALEKPMHLFDPDLFGCLFFHFPTSKPPKHERLKTFGPVSCDSWLHVFGWKDREGCHYLLQVAVSQSEAPAVTHR